MSRQDIIDAQVLLGVTPDGDFGPASLKALKRVLNAPVVTDGSIPDSYWPILSKIESGDRPYVKASTSSASGLFQFVRATWIGEGGAWGSDMSKAFGGLTPSVEEQKQRARTFTQKNANILVAAKIPVNAATLYAAHFLGAFTAKAVLGAPDDANAGSLAGPAATKANPSILKDKTVRQFKDWLEKKTGVRP